ncbi:hypothetical protein R3P38DRAFT_3361293 [Favolaschia claudopus]|uniref:Uncharacterized protein n=1 Tax=Favolaschia claudopus TaxID=2862362 RepID=A0AAW0AVF8_9AGAR
MSKKTYPNKTKSMIKTAAENKKASSATADAKRKPMRWEQTATCQMRGHAVGRMVQNAEEPTAPTTGCVESLFLQSDPGLYSDVRATSHSIWAQFIAICNNNVLPRKRKKVFTLRGPTFRSFLMFGRIFYKLLQLGLYQQIRADHKSSCTSGSSTVNFNFGGRARSGSAHALSDRRDRIRFGGSGHSAWTFRRFDGSATGSVPADFGSGSDNDALGFGTQEGQDESDKQAEDQARSGSGP